VISSFIIINYETIVNLIVWSFTLKLVLQACYEYHLTWALLPHIVKELSGKCQGISECLESGHPVWCSYVASWVFLFVCHQRAVNVAITFVLCYCVEAVKWNVSSVSLEALSGTSTLLCLLTTAGLVMSIVSVQGDHLAGEVGGWKLVKSKVLGVFYVWVNSVL